jgi:RNA polymerase sigma-B factor
MGFTKHTAAITTTPTSLSLAPLATVPNSTAYCPPWPLLTPLSALSEAAANSVKAQLLHDATPWVTTVATSLARRHNDPLDDLTQAGYLGFLRALTQYSPQQSRTFTTVATHYVLGEMQQFLRHQSQGLTPPKAIDQLCYRLNKTLQHLEQHLGRTPTNSELLVALQCQPEQLALAQQVERRQQFISLEQWIGQDNDPDCPIFMEQLTDINAEDCFFNTETRIIVTKALQHLSPTEQQVLQLAFYNDLSQQAIAQQLGVSQMQVSRRLKQALASLNHHLAEAL